MSLRSGVTLLGAVIGNFIAPGIGGNIGAIVGGLIGSAIDPVKIEGPRQTDGQAMFARPGVAIPWGEGIFRVSGQLMACQPGPPTEHKHSETVGKGGPKQISYTYTRTHAVLICEGPIAGVRRIWRNNKLVYDTTPQPTQSAGEDNDEFEARLQEWVDARAGGSAFADKFTLYLGDSSQMPDPDLEALFGVGEVSPQRGSAYAVFPADDVTETGLAVPKYDLEVATGGAAGSFLPRYAMYIADSGGSAVTKFDRRHDNAMSTFATGTSPRGMALSPANSYLAVCNRTAGTVTIWNTVTDTASATFPCGGSPIACCWSIDGSHLYVVDSGDDKVRKVTPGGTIVATSADLTGTVGNGAGICTTPDGAEVWAVSDFGASVLNPSTLAITHTIAASNAWRIAMHPDGTKAYSAHSGASNFYKFNIAAKTRDATIALDGIGKDVCWAPDGTHAYFAITNAHEAVQKVSSATNTKVGYLATTGNEIPSSLCIDDLGQYILAPTAGYVVDVYRISDFTLVDSVPIGGTPAADYSCARALP